MLTIQELKEKRAHKYECAKDVLATVDRSGLAMTEAQEKSIKDYEAEGDELDAKIKSLEAQEALANRINEKRNAMSVKETRSAPAMEIHNSPRVSVEVKDSNVFCRNGSLKAFSNDAKGERDAYTSGQFIRALCGNEKAQRWCKENGIETRAALGEGSSSIGGALVPTPLENSILVFREKYGIARANCRVWPMSENTLYIPKRSTSLSAVYTAENAALTESEPTFTQVQIVCKKLGCLSLVSSEINDDSVISVADYLAQDIAFAMALKEDQDIFTGAANSGSGTINGFTHYLVDTNHTASCYTAAASGTTFLTTTIDDITGLMALLPQYAAANAKFFCSKVAKELIFGRLAAKSNGNTTITYREGVGDTFLGVPIVVTQVMPSAVTSNAGAVYLLYGDMDQTIVIGERRGITVTATKDRYFEFDQIGIKATQRWNSALANDGSNSVVGGMVGLVGAA